MSLNFKQQREIEALVTAEWSNFTLDLDRPHPAIVLRDGANVCKVFVSTTPSDYRALMNIRSDIRRAVRKLKEARAQ